MTTTERTSETREEHFAAALDKLRLEHPTFPEHYWQDVWTRQRLQWQIYDLTNGIAHLAGYYGFRAEHTGNADLAELVAKLDALRAEAYR